MSGEQTGLGSLVYAASEDALACNRESGKLVYKGENVPRGWTMVSFAWDKTANDLDICAYWSAVTDLKVGYKYAGGGSYEHGPYKIEYSGDEVGVAKSEWVKIIMSPWKAGVREFVAHLNFYGYDPDTFPGMVCTVVASQEGGTTIVKRNVECSIEDGKPATTESKSVKICFDKNGKLVGIA